MREPSTIFFQLDHVRRTIIASYWIVILLALPLWWRTTSIERLQLPSFRVKSQASKELKLPIQIELPKSYSSLSTTLQAQLVPNLSQHGLSITINEQEDSNHSHEITKYTIKHGEGEPSVRDRELTYDLTGSNLSELPAILFGLLAPPQQGHLVVQYSPRYRLAFTLLNEDSTSGNFIQGWEASNAIKRFISPLLDQLSLLHNFTIESQVQYHAPLAFKPRPLPDGSFGLSPEDLSVFVNSAEWTLSSSASNDPVLHFIVFIPAQPLHMLDANDNSSPSRSFLLPQWGGIVIQNPMSMKYTLDVDDVFSIFARQLLALLGVPPLPPMIKQPSNLPTTQWQLDALLRRRTLENTQNSQDTLRSIVTLVDQIEGMPVGWNVKDDIHDALYALERVYALSSSSIRETVQQSARAVVLASRAFFNPDMLALLYFPAEHKYAVYTPLFASAVIPLIAAALREVLAWRRSRREATERRREQAAAASR